MNKTCNFCQKEFNASNNKRKYCSKKCYTNHKSVLLSGKPVNQILEWRKNGGKPWNKGIKIKLSDHHINRIREGLKKRNRDWQIGSNNKNWKGGKYIAHGYVRMINPERNNPGEQRYIFEHRHVMEQHLKRKLLPHEIIHHKNGIKTDNRIENLSIVLRKTHRGKVICPHCENSFFIK